MIHVLCYKVVGNGISGVEMHDVSNSMANVRMDLDHVGTNLVPTGHFRVEFSVQRVQCALLQL